MWNRIAGFDPSELDAAFAEHEVVKATLMRVTLHAVHAEDYPSFHAAMLGALRAFRLSDRRVTELGLYTADLDAFAPELVKFAARARTTAELQAMSEERLGVLPDPGVWWALRTFVSLVHAPTGGPWSFGLRPSHIASATGASAADRDESRQRLVRRYLEAFGPASVADFAQFAKLARSAARDALSARAHPLQQLEGPDGVALFDVPAAPRRAEDTPPRLG